MLGRLMGMFAIIPATMILTVSFFVLFALRKVESNVLKAFGYVVAAMLWVSVLLISSAGVYTLATGRCPMQKMMMEKRGICQEMMGKKMMMDKEKMPEMKQ
jgi:Cu/Ag efflux pump CusA